MVYWLFPDRVLVLSWKAKSICGFRSHRAPLCPSKVVTLRSWDSLTSTLWVAVLDIQHLPTFSELGRSQGKLPAPAWALLSLSLPCRRRVSSAASSGRAQFGGFTHALYPPRRLMDGTRELKHINDLTERQKHDRRIWAESIAVCSLNVSHQFGWEGCLRLWGERKMQQVHNVHVFK